jgi:hypothetical protein
MNFFFCIASLAEDLLLNFSFFLEIFVIFIQDVGVWLDAIGLGIYKQIFKENGINGEYLDNLSTFTTEQILRFIRRCHMKWGDFIVLCKELRNIKGKLLVRYFLAYGVCSQSTLASISLVICTFCC